MKNAGHSFGLAALLIPLLTGVATSQTHDGFSGIALKTGDTVAIVLSDGARIIGRVSQVESTLLTVNGRTVGPQRAVQIDRIGDPLWNGVGSGALIGFAFFKFTLPGALIMNAAIDRDCVLENKASCVVAMMAASAAVGGVWDKLRVGRTTVFLNGVVQRVRLTVMPQIGADRAGIRASITWK